MLLQTTTILTRSLALSMYLPHQSPACTCSNPPRDITRVLLPFLSWCVCRKVSGLQNNMMVLYNWGPVRASNLPFEARMRKQSNLQVEDSSGRGSGYKKCTCRIPNTSVEYGSVTCLKGQCGTPRIKVF